MQNINGQMVDVDAIEKLRGYYDAQLDASEWCDFDAETDESYDLTMEIRKAQYDTMVDSLYNLKQRLTYASRHAKGLEEDKKDLIDEIHYLKEFIDELQQYILEEEFMSGWFEYLVKNGDIKAYKEDGLLSYSALPFYQDKVDELIDKGISMTVIQDYARKKYQEWKANKEKEGEEIEEA